MDWSTKKVHCVEISVYVFSKKRKFWKSEDLWYEDSNLHVKAIRLEKNKKIQNICMWKYYTVCDNRDCLFVVWKINYKIYVSFSCIRSGTFIVSNLYNCQIMEKNRINIFAISNKNLKKSCFWIWTNPFWVV